MDTYTTMYHRRSVRRTAIRATALALALVGAQAARSAPSVVEPTLAGSKRLTTSESSVMQDAQELRLAGSKRLSTSESS